ncbi:MAG: FkbM family methyltransferase [Caldisphaera sp.]
MISNMHITDYILANLKGPLANLLNSRRVVTNYWKVVLFKYGLIKTAWFKLYSGESFYIRNTRDYENFWKNKMVYLTNNYKIKIYRKLIKVYFGEEYPRYYSKSNVSFFFDNKNTIGDIIRQIRDILYYKEYKFINPKNKVIVDIGANIGDSAIYFHLRGAKQVYAIEAMPKLYRLMVRNIRINKIINVLPINAVCSASNKIYKLPRNSNWAGDIQEKLNNYTRVKSISLDEIVKRYDIDKGILKIDCEGCEYGIIANARKETLQRFDEIFIEYHYGYIDIESKLKNCGFAVEHTIPARIINVQLNKPIMYVGFIKAKKEII